MRAAAAIALASLGCSHAATGPSGPTDPSGPSAVSVSPQSHTTAVAEMNCGQLQSEHDQLWHDREMEVATERPQPGTASMTPHEIDERLHALEDALHAKGCP